ncbi:MAG TPA: hypothetical protein VH592_09040 [Gemmataceae bacterium]|jgi:hypothetical protein
MDQEKKMPQDVADSSKGAPSATSSGATQDFPAPASDQTNPHNQEPTGEWNANNRAAERKNNEPGLTDAERKRRRW